MFTLDDLADLVILRSSNLFDVGLLLKIWEKQDNDVKK